MWLSETADNLAHRRARDDQDGDSLAVLEQEEVLQQSTINHLQAAIATLAQRSADRQGGRVSEEQLHAYLPRRQISNKSGWRLQDLAKTALRGHPDKIRLLKGRISGRASIRGTGAQVRTRSMPASGVHSVPISPRQSLSSMTPPVPSVSRKSLTMAQTLALVQPPILQGVSTAPAIVSQLQGPGVSTGPSAVNYPSPVVSPPTSPNVQLRTPPIPSSIPSSPVIQHRTQKVPAVHEVKWNLRKLHSNLQRGVPRTGRHIFTMQ